MVDRQFTAEEVLHYYNVLKMGKTREERNQANENILVFRNSTQAWSVAN